jgi:UDP-galactopyranose mutase
VHWDHHRGDGDFQGNAVTNHPSLDVPHTRVVDHKHFAPWERLDRTFVSVEFSKESGPQDEPFYPKRLATDRAMLDRYLAKAANLERHSFLGRLATYRYMDMHHAIDDALDFARRWLRARGLNERPPVLPQSASSLSPK